MTMALQPHELKSLAIELATALPPAPPKSNATEAGLWLDMRKIYAITAAIHCAPEFVEEAPRDVLAGALDAIHEIALKAFPATPKVEASEA